MKLENDEKKLESKFSSSTLNPIDEKLPSMVTTIDENLKDPDHYLHDTSKSDSKENDEKNLECVFSSNKGGG